MLGACGDSGSTATPTSVSPEPTGSGYLDSPGPYAVGRRTVTMIDPARSGRTLTVDLVYPADPAVAAGAPGSSYVFVPGIDYPSPLAKQDVPVAPGRFPVVLYSHGASGTRFISSFLTEALASYGFVVAAPDHLGDAAADRLLGGGVNQAENQRMRPADVSFVLTNVLAADAANPVGASVDPDRVAVIGHSFGGFTALTAVAGWDTVPADPRIKAVVGMAPYTRDIPDAVLERVNVPTMLIGGTADGITPIQPNVERPWNLVPGRPLYNVELERAGHQSFTDVCAYQQRLASLPNAPEILRDYVTDVALQGCAPNLLDIGTAQRATISYNVAFLKVQLAGDAAYERYLGSNPPEATVTVKR